MAGQSSTAHHGDLYVTASDAGQHNFAGLLGAWVADLDERERAVFEHRIAHTDQTLADIGRAYSCSRERIRQLQGKLAGALSSWLSRCPAAAEAATLRARLKRACPVLAPWGELIRTVPELTDRVAGTGVCLADLVTFLVPELCLDGDWAGWQPIGDVRRHTVEIATHSVPVGARTARLAVLKRKLVLEGRHWAAWLNSCGLREFRGWVVLAKATVPELAEATLAVEGHPMTTAEIASQVGVKPWKLRDRCLGRDKRFRRTALGVFGLAEWDLPTYRTVREEIIGEILACGGKARLDDVAASLASRFGVSETSVEHYACGPEFTRSGGMIWLAQTCDETESDKPRPAAAAAERVPGQGSSD
jgi:hypothetical protein